MVQSWSLKLPQQHGNEWWLFLYDSHLMPSKFGGTPAFLSSRPRALTTMLSSKELTALENPPGDGWELPAGLGTSCSPGEDRRAAG